MAAKKEQSAAKPAREGHLSEIIKVRVKQAHRLTVPGGYKQLSRGDRISIREKDFCENLYEKIED